MHESILIFAIFIDLLFGEPSEKYHPVVWIGSLIDFLKNILKKNRLSGCILVSIVVGVSIAIGCLIISLHPIVFFIFSIYFLKSTISIKSLLDASYKIMALIEKNNSFAKKELIALVGRDTKNLSKEELSSAVIESVAENFVDGIVSPIFYFVLFGLPGAIGYKAINTLDSMIGYRHFGAFGWCSARMDDVANYIPSRISIIFIFIASLIYGSLYSSIQVVKKDCNNTPSPNSGWSMSAMAGALEVSLKKPCCYLLGAEFNLPTTNDIERANNIIKMASYLLIIVALGVMYFTLLPL